VTYAVHVRPRALRDLDELPADVRRRVLTRLEALAENPRPQNAEHLTHPFRGILRLRIGNYRVSYSIDEKARVVDVWRAGHRSTFYLRLKGSFLVK